MVKTSHLISIKYIMTEEHENYINKNYIKVAKAKFKKIIYKVLSKQIPQVKPLLKSVLDLVDTIFGEDWVLEIAKFLGQIGKKFLKTLTPQNIESFLKDKSNEISRKNIIEKIFQ